MSITYTDNLPLAEELYSLYDSVKWNDFLKLNKELIHQASVQSWFVYSAYHHDVLIGTGRIISDGIINAYLCGLVVHPNYRNRGIGAELLRGLKNRAIEKNLHLQLFCSEDITSYYENNSFEVFATGMKLKK